MPPIRIALASGDGIGPEIVNATLDLFRAAGVMKAGVDFVPVEMGAAVFAKGNSRGMTEDAVKTVEDCGLLFKGPMETPKGGGGKSINVTARKLWNAYANLRVFKTIPGVESVYSKAGIPIDMCIVRENLEDTYGGVEHRISADTVQGRRLMTAPGCDEVHRFAFITARRLGIKKVHCGHKANIMKMTDGLFLERFKAVAKDFPEIETADVIVDALCMNLVVRPQQYQMVVLPNLQGDIVSDLCAGLVGGLGFAPSANIGKHISIFEAVHGTAPDIAGKGLANPTSIILSGLMMLRHIRLAHEAAIIENALLATLESGVRTGDFGDKSHPAVGTRDFTKAIMDRLGEAPQAQAQARPDPRRRPRRARSPRPSRRRQQNIRTFHNVATRNRRLRHLPRSPSGHRRARAPSPPSPNTLNRVSPRGRPSSSRSSPIAAPRSGPPAASTPSAWTTTEPGSSSRTQARPAHRNRRQSSCSNASRTSSSSRSTTCSGRSMA